MILTQWALLTCLFYLTICVIIDLAIAAVGYLGWVGAIGIGGWQLRALFGIVWYVSLVSAFRAYAACFRPKR
jgi:hypothetical protein